VIARDARIDVEVEGFFAPYLAATGPGAASTGERCFYAEHCASGRCTFPPDAPHRGYCAAPCDDRADCPAEMTCTDAWCAYPRPSPGAIGGACESDVDCADAECTRLEGEDRSRCADRCFPGNRDPCAAGFECRPSTDRPGQSYCAVEPGGCAASGRAGRSSVLLPLAVALLALRRRRSRYGMK
jgi:hypothetical protein